MITLRDLNEPSLSGSKPFPCTSERNRGLVPSKVTLHEGYIKVDTVRPNENLPLLIDELQIRFYVGVEW
jgi:hypothetical protein